MAIKVIHIMADGTVRDSMKGVTVPYEQSRLAYELLKEIRDNNEKTACNK